MKDYFEKVYFEKSQQTTTKVLKNLTHPACKELLFLGLLKLFTFLRVYLLNKRMADSKKIYPCVHKIKNKEEQTNKKR